MTCILFKNLTLDPNVTGALEIRNLLSSLYCVFLQVHPTGPVSNLDWTLLLCISVYLYICGCMIIGQTQKMLSCDWSRGIQYNLHEPQSREVSVHKESIMIV